MARMILKLDGWSIDAAKPYLAALSREQRLALLPEARRQEARRLKEVFSRNAWYARKEARDPGVFERMAASYLPECLVTDPPWHRPSPVDRIYRLDGSDVDPRLGAWPTDWYRLVDDEPVVGEHGPLEAVSGTGTHGLHRWFVRVGGDGPCVLAFRRDLAFLRYFAESGRPALRALARVADEHPRSGCIGRMARLRLG